MPARTQYVRQRRGCSAIFPIQRALNNLPPAPAQEAPPQTVAHAYPPCVRRPLCANRYLKVRGLTGARITIVILIEVELGVHRDEKLYDALVEVPTEELMLTSQPPKAAGATGYSVVFLA